MKLSHMGSTSKDGGCPELYATDRGTYVVQGARGTDPEALEVLQARGLPEHETAVGIPAALLDFVPKSGV